MGHEISFNLYSEYKVWMKYQTLFCGFNWIVVDLPLFLPAKKKYMYEQWMAKLDCRDLQAGLLQLV